jgi:hypothetical protein
MKLKLSLTLALFIIASLLWRGYVMATLSDTFPIGFPLPTAKPTK